MRIAEGLTTVVPDWFVKTNASTSVPVRLSNTRIKFRSATLRGEKAVGTNNTGTVRIGWSGVDGEQTIPISAGEEIGLEAGSGEALDFYDIWLDCATANDGVVVADYS